jgi:ABC-type Fe3+-siderophore transport system permease subunit
MFDLVRVLSVFFAGSLLSIVGTLSQVITGNPLASSSTLGLDGLAVLLVLATHILRVFYFPSLPSETITLAFAIIFLLVLYLKVPIKHFVAHKRLIILGICFNLLIGAIFSFMQFMFMAHNWEFPIELWFGNFKHTDLSSLILLIGFYFIYIFYFSYRKKEINIMAVDLKLARNLAPNFNLTQKQLVLMIMFAVILVTTYFGIFSFLSLILPHILRQFRYFALPYRELVMGSLLSGLLLSGLDLLCYHFLIDGAEVPVGMLSAIIGSFVLMIIVVKKGEPY